MDRVYNYIGLMYKANKIKIGFKAFKNLSKGGRVFLVVYTSDASNKIKKYIERWSLYNNVPCIEFGTKYFLSKFLGKHKDVAVISIIDYGISVKLKKLIEQSGGEIIGENKGL